jgi:cytosine/adenosine deaminase-related metal-dependent hydrolase
MLLGHGTTTVLDVEAAPELLPAAWAGTPLRVFSYREMLHVKNRQPAAEVVERAVNDWLGMPEAQGRVGLSPHAPYTTSPQLLELAARAAHRRRWRLVTHVAESEEEFQMYMYRHGPMHDWLKNQRDMSDCGHGSPVQHLERCGYLDSNLIAAHVNYLWRHDAGILGRNGVHVVHCPRSHDYFKHLKFPREELENAGVTVCLGTDSLATTRVEGDAPLALNLFAEMQSFAQRSPELASASIVRMATLHGARALGRTGELGELSQNAMADLVVIPFTGGSAEVADAIVHHQGPVRAVMIGGSWAIAPP